MHDFPITRIAVKLFLIVAMAIQPVAPCLAGLDSASCCGKSSAFIHDGCRCCDMEASVDRCCCCTQPADAIRQAPSCCSGKDQIPAVSNPASEYATSVSTTELIPVDPAGELGAICLCGRNTPPLSDSSPRTRINEGRVSVFYVVADLDGIDVGCRMLLASSSPGARANVPVHFSQLLLCIWRL